MYASDLIAKLQAVVAEHGDMKVFDTNQDAVCEVGVDTVDRLDLDGSERPDADYAASCQIFGEKYITIS